MPKTLTDTEIRHRLTRLRNLERLHAEDQETKAQLRAENAELRAENAELKRCFTELFEAQAARIEELETMVFGRRPGGGAAALRKPKHKPKQSRTADSYRRPPPKDEEITSEKHYTVSTCSRCGGELTDIETYVRYVVDIVLAAFSDVPLKTAEKHTVERGWCRKCGHYSSARDLRGPEAALGPNVRLLVTYLAAIQGLTLGQIQMLLQDMYDFAIADGEIVAILDAERKTRLPAYEQLKQTIRAGPAHFDETRLPIQSEQNAGYAFAMVGADGTAAEHDVVFHLADSRGKGHAETLAGDSFASVGITDRYSAYKHLFVLHQICWAHLHRTGRDLSRLECLGEATRHRVAQWYAAFGGVYAALRQYHAEPFDEARRQAQAAALLRQVEVLCQPDGRDPKKLADLKLGMLEYKDSLFVCLTTPGVPPDNNKAERVIRKLVLKRVRSFGAKTKKGAQTLEVLLSVCWSLWQRDRRNFFVNLKAAGQAA